MGVVIPLENRTDEPGIEALVAETGADELMIVSDVFDHAARLRSFELIAAAYAPAAIAPAPEDVA